MKVIKYVCLGCRGALTGHSAGVHMWTGGVEEVCEEAASVSG